MTTIETHPSYKKMEIWKLNVDCFPVYPKKRRKWGLKRGT
jgi:hypothetical protein